MKTFDTAFLTLFMEKTAFPEEARVSLLEAAGTLERAGQREALMGALEFFYQNDFSVKETQPLVEDTAQESGLSPYTVWMLLLIQGAKQAREDYLGQGIREEIFWDTFCDLRYKALECKENYGVWGTFVAFWYPIFYSVDIVKLGRLEYETRVYDGPAFEQGGVSLKAGDKVYSIHIPSSGEPFDQAARLDSYRRAYEFFGPQHQGGPLICVCHSWLLYPAYKGILKPGSNIAGFMEDFHIIETEDGDFGDAWRVFGPQHTLPPQQLPEDTSMRRAFKRHLIEGGPTGEGLGVLLFDGEKLV